MLKRKIERRLEKFYSDNGKSALLIDGARQVGKSFIVESFGRSHYESVVVIDFLHQEEAKAIFKDVADGTVVSRRSSRSTSRSATTPRRIATSTRTANRR